MKKFLLLIVFIFSLAGSYLLLADESSAKKTSDDKDSPSSPQYNFENLKLIKFLENGPSDKKVDIVILADGYTSKDFKRYFKKDVTSHFMTHFFRTRPFKKFKKHFNVYGLKTISFDSGGEDKEGLDQKRNIFNCTFGTNGSDRLLTVQDKEAVRRALKAVPFVDIAFILVNDFRYGGSGGTIRLDFPEGSKELPLPVYSKGQGSVDIAIHEFAHPFANLADEYAEAATAPYHPLPTDGSDIDKPNVTMLSQFDNSSKKSMQNSIKWKHFFKYRKGKFWLGAYEGGHYRDKGIFHPSKQCRMKQLNSQDFCYVCQEELVKAIYRTVGKEFNDEDYHKKYPMR